MAEPHRWQPGESGNPEGRPPNPVAADLRMAIKRVQDSHKEFNDDLTEEEISQGMEKPTDLLDHFVERAMSSDTVLAHLMKKIAPDLKQIDIDSSILMNGQLDLGHLSDKDLDAEVRFLSKGLDRTFSVLPIKEKGETGKTVKSKTRKNGKNSKK